MEALASPAPAMTFWEHLQELRVRLVRCVLAMLGAFALTYGFRFRLWNWAQMPFQEAMARKLKVSPAALQPWAFTDLTEPFFSLMRLSFWAAVALAAPVLFYQVWAFIRPGLLPRERRLVLPFVLGTSGMFLSGLAFAYILGFRFLGDILFQEAAQAGLRANLHIDAYLDLFLTTLGMTGLMFELPVLTFFLARFRLVSASLLLRYWRHAVIAILVFAAFFTPGDVVITTVFFSAVLLALYFVSVLVAWAARPR